MADRRHEMPPKKAAAALALATGATNAEAAKVAGCHVRTVARWRGDDAFVVEVRWLAAAALEDASRVLAGGAVEAARYLSDVAAGRARGDAVRVNASRIVVTVAPQLKAAVELEVRLCALERVTGIATDAIAA